MAVATPTANTQGLKTQRFQLDCPLITWLLDTSIADF